MVGRPCGVRYALILRHFQPKTKLRAYANPARLGTVHHNGLADASGSAHGESLARSRTGWPPTAPLRGYPGDHPHPPHPALRAGIAGCFGGGGLGHHRHRQCPANPLERLREDTVARLHERLDLLAVYGDNGQRTVLAVVDRVDTSAEQMLRESLGELSATTQLELLDRQTYDTLQRLVEAGIVSLNKTAARTLHQSSAQSRQRSEARNRWLAEARKQFEEAARKRRMAGVLAEGGFPVEAVAPLREAVELGLHALGRALGEESGESLSLGFIESRLVTDGLAPSEAPTLVARLREGLNGGGEPAARKLSEDGNQLLDHAAEALDRMALRG